MCWNMHAIDSRLFTKNYYDSSIRNNGNVAHNLLGTLLTIDSLIYNTCSYMNIMLLTI